jgi:hypothetical protein
MPCSNCGHAKKYHGHINDSPLFPFVIEDGECYAAVGTRLGRKLEEKPGVRPLLAKKANDLRRRKGRTILREDQLSLVADSIVRQARDNIGLPPDTFDEGTGNICGCKKYIPTKEETS